MLLAAVKADQSASIGHVLDHAAIAALGVPHALTHGEAVMARGARPAVLSALLTTAA